MLSQFKIKFFRIVSISFLSLAAILPLAASAQNSAELDRGVNCMFEVFATKGNITAKQAAESCVQMLSMAGSYRCKDDFGDWQTIRDWRYCVDCAPKYCKGCCEAMTDPGSNIRKSCMSLCTASSDPATR